MLSHTTCLTEIPSQIFKVLHEMLNNGQDKKYWTDVIEFWGELLVKSVLIDEVSIERYQFFLKVAGNFSPNILKQRLMPQWKRLCKITGFVPLGEFLNDLVNILSAN
jgi:hypothetical protein